MATELYLGLISGTSADGIEAVVAEFSGTRFLGLRGHHHHAYPAELRAALLSLSLDLPARAPAAWAALDQAIAASFADAANALLGSRGLSSSAIRALGSHGQTVFHDGPRGLTTQLGDPSLIAARTGITTIADFRRADLAHGGQGAPLVPAFHHALFASAGEARVGLNLGGIANVTLLPDSDQAQVRGFDTGPANGLMDEWMLARLGTGYDADGRCAATGRIIAPMLAQLLDDPYFRLPPPKSTGRDYFRLRWVAERWPTLDGLDTADVMATLCELSAASIADAILEHQPQTRQVLACGGGTRNPVLMARIAARLPGTTVTTTDSIGLDAQCVEAAAFAWLAMRHELGLPGNLPAVTGARRAVVLGGRYPAA